MAWDFDRDETTTVRSAKGGSSKGEAKRRLPKTRAA